MDISKINSYAVTDVAGPEVTKINAYAVTEDNSGMRINKINAYAIVDANFIPPSIGLGNMFMVF